MIKATPQDKPRITEILARSFDKNQSVNYVIPQDSKRDRRIHALMNYSFDVCHAFGDVFLSGDRSACALAIRPEKKKTTLNSVLWDARLVLSCTGLANAGKALRREALIKKTQPEGSMYYLWFIGVEPEAQRQGHGSQLLSELIEHSKRLGRPIYLETSTTSNLPWYENFGFQIYSELDLGYRLYFLKRALNDQG